MRRGELERARDLVETSRELFERDDDPWRRTWGELQTSGTRGAIARDAGDDATARELIGRSALLARETSFDW